MQNEDIKPCGYDWISFLANEKVVEVTNERDFNTFKEFLKQHELTGILNGINEFEDWQNLAVINNKNPNYFLFEYDNYKGITFDDNKEKSVSWYGCEPLKATDLLNDKDIEHNLDKEQDIEYEL